MYLRDVGQRLTHLLWEQGTLGSSPSVPTILTTGRKGVWFILPASEAGARWFESSRPDHLCRQIFDIRISVSKRSWPIALGSGLPNQVDGLDSRTPLHKFAGVAHWLSARLPAWSTGFDSPHSLQAAGNRLVSIAVDAQDLYPWEPS